MTDIMLIVHPYATPPPTPWECGWGVTTLFEFAALPHGGIARAPRGTPIPDGCAEYAPVTITDAMRDAARASWSADHRSLARRGALSLASIVGQWDDDDIARWLGMPVFAAQYAPLGVTPDAASEAYYRATEEGPHCASAMSCGVIRTAARGYDAWCGIGGAMVRLGTAASVADAEAMVLRAVRARRAEHGEFVRATLTGWSPDTPTYGTTIADLGTDRDHRAITIYRGPMTAAELPHPTIATLGCSSWDLPVAAIYRGDDVERHDDVVTWDDDASRAAHRARSRAGQLRAQDDAR